MQPNPDESYLDCNEKLGRTFVQFRLSVLVLLAMTGTMLGCGGAATPANERPPEKDPSAGNLGDQRGNTALHPVRYGYRGGPYTSGGKPRPKVSSNEVSAQRGASPPNGSHWCREAD